MRPLLVILFLTFASGCVSAPRTAGQHLVGRWEGMAEHGEMKLLSVVEFERTAGGALAATITVPDERLFRKRLEDVRVEGERVRFNLRAEATRRIEFEGTIAGDVIAGTMRGGRIAMPLTLRRAGDLAALPYDEEQVQFRNGDVTLAGALLRPRTPAPHPAVILIHGSSTPSRDDFRFYADLFARHGIAALIYDKRDVGSEPSGMNLVDLRDLAGDALAGVELLKTRADIDLGRIGLWGLSQGGWVAPIAAADSPDVAFVITVSAPGVTYADLNINADTLRMRARGVAAGEIEEARRALHTVDEYVRGRVDARRLQSMLDEAWTKPWARHTTLPRRVPDGNELKSWMRWRNLDLDPVQYWARIKVPVLAVYGEHDDVVPVAPSVERIREALARAGNRDATIKVYTGADHVIRPAEGWTELLIEWTRQRTAKKLDIGAW